MGAGFIRRYGFQPDAAVLNQIEGVAILDLPQPQAITGVGTGTVALVGEFADCTYATTIDASTGAVSTRYQPQEIVSSVDLIAKMGGFDATLGEFGGAFGNGYAMVAGKTFTRLITVPINLASSRGMRVFRKLPLHKSGGTTAEPLVPITAGFVAAGTKFQTGAGVVVKTASPVQFTASLPKATGTNGVTAAGGSTATHSFVSAGADFSAAGVVEGDVLMLGVYTDADADTYRIVSVNSATSLTIEQQDGSPWATTGGTDLKFSIYAGSVADSDATHQASEDAGYTVLARPLTATIADSTVLTPTDGAVAVSGTSWTALTGLAARATTATGGIVHSSTTQVANAANSSDLNAAYSDALDVLLADVMPQNQTNIVICARSSAGIAAALKNHVVTASSQGLGRMAIVAPGLGAEGTGKGVQTVATAAGSTTAASATTATFGVASSGASERNERVIYTWPGVKQLFSEAQTSTIAGADGSSVTSGLIDVPMSGHYASILSNLAPERNPGELSTITRNCLASANSLQRGAPTTLGINDYITMKQFGVSAIRFDVSDGPVIQSGITSSVTSGEKTVARRRMADFIQDSLARQYNRFAKQPLNAALRNTILGETDAFLASLLSATNPETQRIAAYSVDGKSGNTPALEAQGIYVVVVRVQTLASADVIVLNSQIGEFVQVTAS
jgi:hypothetical protein